MEIPNQMEKQDHLLTGYTVVAPTDYIVVDTKVSVN